MDFPRLQQHLQRFAEERDWPPYHTPKNLAMALMVESAELLEHFQWLTPEQSLQLTQDPQAREAVADEVADVLLYLAQFAAVTGIDIDAAVERKLVKNAQKYPASSTGASDHN